MTEQLKIKTKPDEIYSEYKKGNEFKSSIGDLGIFEQTKMNERFFVGDHWYGVQSGNTRPLIRKNIIKRIGEHKISIIGAAPVAVNYSAEGIPDTKEIKKQAKNFQTQMIGGEASLSSSADNVEISVITDAMSNYQKICAERLKFNIKTEQILRNAYVSGTGILYTYWDETIDTGLYADDSRTKSIKGDIACEVLDVENVVFGDPNNDDIQSQPYILLAQRLDVASVRREAKQNGLSVNDIIPDGSTEYNSGDRGEKEPDDSRRVTVITKLYKEYDDNGKYKVMAVKCTEKALVREAWDVGLTLYPIAKFLWERRRNCAYGDSEITFIIPNQIAINKMSVAECSAALNIGQPKMYINKDFIDPNTPITNDPGQIIEVFGDNGHQAVGYINAPNWSTQHQNAINDLAQGTLADNGATEAALGNLRPDNAAAIIQLREAALQPLQLYQNRFYDFIEDVARVWADMWINKYGNRSLKIETRNGTEYIPFNADRYKNLVFTAKVDVGASTLWSEAAQISTLDSLLASQLLTPEQYLERMPKGIIPRLTELLEDIQQKTAAAEQMQSTQSDIMSKFASQYPQEYEQFATQSPEEQELMLKQIMGGMNYDG